MIAPSPPAGALPAQAKLFLRIPEKGNPIINGRISPGIIKPNQSTNDARLNPDATAVLKVHPDLPGDHDHPTWGIGRLHAGGATFELRGDSPNMHRFFVVPAEEEGNKAHAEVRAFVDGTWKKKLASTVKDEYRQRLAQATEVIKQPGQALEGWVEP